jgi:hypothetical protein
MSKVTGKHDALPVIFAKAKDEEASIKKSLWLSMSSTLISHLNFRGSTLRGAYTQ